jgi:signal transduction histidine kinase
MLEHLTKILVIEDDPQDIDLLEEYLEKAKQFPVTIETVQTLTEGLERLENSEIDIVLCDLSLPDEQGLDTFGQLYAQFPHVPIIILSGLDDEEVAVKALSLGAQDYLIKGFFNSNLLVRAIRYAIERQQLRYDLQQQAQLLEYRVSERTRELEQANSQLREMEAKLREALAQEKELSELKSRIITTISHEYRTPLTTIQSSAELLENYCHKWDKDKQLKHVGRIQACVKHMTELVNDVLFINKAEFDKLEFQPSLGDLEALFDEVIDDLQVGASEKHQLILESCSDLPLLCFDGKLIRQILINLVSNAIKYSPDGGSVWIRLSSEDNKVIFQVSDKGIGIPVNEQHNLFESFSRASNVGAIAGTGLGLSIVKKGVDLHGGNIAVKSELGVGTTFTVMLPKSKKSHAVSQCVLHERCP